MSKKTKNFIKKTTCALLCFVMIFGLNVVTPAEDSIKELNDKKEELDAKEKEAKKRLDELAGKKNNLTDEIEALDIEIGLATEQLDFIHQRLDNKNAELEQTKKDLELAEIEKANHYEALKQRIKYIQENGRIGYFQVFFNSKSFGDFLNRVEYVNDIITYDQNMYDNLQRIEDTIVAKKHDIEIQVKDIEVLLKEQEEKMLELEQAKEAKNIVMSEIESDEATYNQHLDELEAESKKIEDEIKKYMATQAASGGSYSSGTGASPNGQFGWPVSGGYYRISSGFVNRTNPITGRGELHTGLDIPAPYGTSILAGEDGVVISAGWNGGYGNCVKIDHGNGVSTLYGHNSSLVVSAGQYVTRGQEIAKCGSTGMSTGNHCHFEVRINGSPVNPAGYLGL